MVELELKFKLKEIPNAVSGLRMIKSKSQSDIYYDTNDYKLIQNGNFMRVRNNKTLDFKLNLNDLSHLYCQELDFNIDEVVDKKSQICEILNRICSKCNENFKNIEELLSNNELKVLAPIEKNRNEYELDETTHICVDEVKNLGTFLEAEIMIDKENITKEESEIFKQELLNKLVKCGLINLENEQVNIGYVELYLKEHNKQAYELGVYKN